MREFKGKVAVITGAASGIGRVMAARCAREGMKVVLSDIETGALERAEQELRATGATVTSVKSDVSDAAQVEALASKALEAFGAVHLLFNNAGVAVGTSVWETDLADWQWVLGVNLWGCIHGVRSFVPRMLAQDTECHIVNTASIQGLLSRHPLTSAYQVAKHGVVALSEQLFHELAQREAKIGVSVLCPGWVKTNIGESGRNRPATCRIRPLRDYSPAQEAALKECYLAIQDGTPAEDLADPVFAAIRENRFYVLPHPEWKAGIRTRMEDILEGRNPTRI